MAKRDDIAQGYLDEAEEFFYAGAYAEAAKIYQWFNAILETGNTSLDPDNFFNQEGLRENGFTPERLKAALAQLADSAPEQFTALKIHMGRANGKRT